MHRGRLRASRGISHQKISFYSFFSNHFFLCEQSNYNLPTPTSPPKRLQYINLASLRPSRKRKEKRYCVSIPLAVSRGSLPPGATHTPTHDRHNVDLHAGTNVYIRPEKLKSKAKKEEERTKSFFSLRICIAWPATGTAVRNDDR